MGTLKSILIQSAAMLLTLTIGVVAGGVYLSGCWVRPTPPAPPPDLVVPASVTGPAGRILTIEASTKAPAVTWEQRTGPTNLDLHPIAAGSVLLVAAPQAGTYTVRAAVVIDQRIVLSDPVQVILTGPPEPKPPQPDPKPPEPKPPSDPFVAALQAAYGADSSSTKAADLALLTGFWEAFWRDMVPSAKHQTCGDLIDEFRRAVHAKMDQALYPIRGLIAAEVDKAIRVKDDTPLSDEIKARYVQAGKRVHQALEAIR